MAPAWMLLIERPTNTDVIMAPAWMLSIKRTRNTDVYCGSGMDALNQTYYKHGCF